MKNSMFQGNEYVYIYISLFAVLSSAALCQDKQLKRINKIRGKRMERMDGIIAAFMLYKGLSARYMIG